MTFPQDGDESPASGQLTADDANLQAGIRDIANLVADSRPLPELLAEVATFAVGAIPGADGVGLALLRADRVDDMVEESAVSAGFVVELDRLQYGGLHEGPGVTAALTRRTVLSGSLGGEKLWPRFGPRAGRLGVHSALALPLMVGDDVVGAITAYAFGKDVFDRHAAELGELFARPAAVAVHNARILAAALALTDRLQEVLLTRPVIDQAIGLIRGRTGRSAEDALAQLRAISQADQRKLADVARDLVEEAVRSARARTAPRSGV
ncbi:GAF and ANTAR domain-containing protein [Candidatus Mycolicibacterium alkanivorans]|uniref:GAF and ANTAR domain-containing protein n=1 Tax=Candidatus Mycolicibacterium alkanivorans TaxID=2954114 RepID=A0ABS9YQD9_9MYCO|nr:GAF and ANTAR domain-containing protein [Candidatus Mycolicibacterium alkanivorans]MCI4673499.1 GAF and ANTAR domain-containing protein [Candidatus Mycolicibacterium alkanivorans]